MRVRSRDRSQIKLRATHGRPYGVMRWFGILRKFKSVGGTIVSLSPREMVSNVAKRLVTERVYFVPHHALSVALRRQRKKYRRYFVALAPFPIEGKPYVCSVRWFKILWKFKPVRGTI